MVTKHELPTSPMRKRPNQKRSQATVDVILDAAFAILKLEEASAFTTSRIARRAGVSVGTLYQYFPDKSAILSAIEKRNQKVHEADTLKALEESGANDLPSVARILVHQLIHAGQHRPETRRAILMNFADRHDYENWSNRNREYADFLLYALNKYAGSQPIREMSDEARHVMVNSLLWPIQLAVISGSPILVLPAFEDELVRLFVRFVCSDPSPKL